MDEKIKNKNLPHIIAILSFLIISITYFSPVLDGKVLVGSDTESWLGMSKEIRDYNSNNSEPALWTNRMFGGMPGYQISFQKPNNILVLFQRGINNFPRVIYTLFLYLIGFYILLLSFKVNPWLSIACAIAFAFGSYNFIILAVGHNSKALAIAYMAPLIGSIIMSFRYKRWLGAALTALFLGLSLSANHLQILYYTLLAIVIFGIIEFIYAIIEKHIKQTLITLSILIGAAAIGVGINSSQLLTTYEYSQHTMRGKSNGLTIDKSSQQEGLNIDYITQWSYDIDETLTLLIPNFKGGSSHGVLNASSATGKKLEELGVGDVEEFLSQRPLPIYWGTQPNTSGPVYVGAIICFLFILGLFLVDNRNKWWLISATILSILLSWGKNFMPFTEFFVDYIPMYKMFRAVSMTLVITTLCMVLMASLALKEILNSAIDKQKKLKAVYISAGIVGGISLIFALFPQISGDFKSAYDANFNGEWSFLQETLPLDRESLLRADAFRSLIFIILTTFLLWLYTKKNLKEKIFLVAIGILFLSDMAPIAKRYLNDNNFKEKTEEDYYQASDADKFILQDRSEFRVLDLTVDIFNSSKPAYFHNCIGGYHAAKLRRYQELINQHLEREIFNVQQSFKGASSEADIVKYFPHNQILNMLNMKYLIYHHNSQPIVNPFANGNVWFVNKCYIEDNPDNEMLKLGTINTKIELVADKEYSDLIPKEIASDSSATIALVSYSPNVLKYKYHTNSKQVAVFSEIYYDKGWKAFIDGEETPFFRANYLLRALAVIPGEHTIEFRFEPLSFKIGNIITGICSILLVIFIGGVLYFNHKKKKAELEKEKD